MPRRGAQVPWTMAESVAFWSSAPQVQVRSWPHSGAAGRKLTVSAELVPALRTPQP